MTIKSFKRTLLGVAIATVSCHASAAGFQLNAQSATGLGRAFAGDAVIADNASVMARNAAAMTLFDKTAMSVGFETVTTMIEVKDATYKNAAYSSGTSANVDNAGDTSIAPNFHIILPIDESLAIGFNAYSNFGTKTEFSDSYVAAEYGGFTQIRSLNLGSSIALKLNDEWSVGGGLDFIWGEGTLKRSLSSSLSGSSVLNIDKATGWGIGFNVGTVYKLNENNRFGLDYHYSPVITAKDGNKEAKLPLPDIAEFSGYHRLEHSKFAFHYSLQYIGWSKFDQIEFQNAGPTSKSYNWKNAWHYSVGTTYYLNPTWTLRAGYMYDMSAQDAKKSISVPDSDRQWLSTGFTYKLDEKSNVDLGFTYLLGKDVNVVEETDLSAYSLGTTSITGTTHADAIMFGLQYSRTF